MIRRMIFFTLLTAVTFVFTGCGAATSYTLNFDPLDPLRIAVVPFYQVDSDGELLESRPPLLHDKQLVGGDPDVKVLPPDAFVQQLVERELMGTVFDVIPEMVIHQEFVHRGLTKGNSFDVEKILSQTPQQLCRALGCDALLYGKLLGWNQMYLGIQSISSVSLELTLVRARDGAVIFQSRVRDSLSRGISKGPTDYTSVVVEPLRGLAPSLIEKLAESVADEALKPLLVANRPGYARSPPPALVVTAHGSDTGILSRRDGLYIAALGTPGCAASASLGSAVINLPMAEVAPGHYTTRYIPLPEDTFDSQPVFVTLEDRFRRRTMHEVTTGQVSLPPEESGSDH